MAACDEPRVIVALDYASGEEALALAGRLDPRLCRVKVGKELFTAAGPGLLGALRESGFDVFLDLKYHDIPNTVAGACKAAAQLGVWMVNVHCFGGSRMMHAAREALVGVARRPLLIGVTVLTSMGQEDLKEIGIDLAPEDQVLRLANLAKSSGLDGVVCSAREAAMLKEKLGKEFRLVTPGIRLPDAAKDDQTRVVTPVDAVRAGADYLVIGRPVTQAADPIRALPDIHDMIAKGV
jgi:orotidine-5'-phosphate decarboxylase